MTKNVGTIDRAVRVIAGLVCIAYALPLGFPETGWNWTGWIFGAALIGSAAFSICPAYSLFGLSSRKA